MADLPLSQRTQGIAALMREGAQVAELLSDLESPSVDPNQPIRAYRGENLIKSLGQPLNTPESAGRWYGFTAEKAARYPSAESRAPSLLGGQVTRTMEVDPREIIEASRNAYYEHGKTALKQNLESGFPKDKAENVYFRYLNEVDDFHSNAMRQLQEGKLPADKFKFMLQTTMAEGVFDKKGPIDAMETIRRGNIGIGSLVGAKNIASEILPYVAKGAGLAALPIDLLLGANKTGLDPEEELAQATGIDPNVFYQMAPEEFQRYKDAYDLEAARQAEMEKEVRAGRNRARVGKEFINAR